MSDRARSYLYIVAGGYLAYTGFGLAKNAVSERPDNFVLYAAIGVAFVVIGGFLAVKNILNISKRNDDDKTEEE